MTGFRLLVFFLVACALAALMAIPVESYEALGSGSTASIPAPPEERLPPPPAPGSVTADSSEHAVPRLWLR
jgi:hypothetical protein